MVTKRKNAGTRDRPESGAPTTAGLDGEAREHAGDGRPASGASDPPELKSLDARVGELLRSELWDDAQEERYDRFTRLAARIFDAPAALILLFDAHRHLFKSRFGFQLGRESQELELCRQAGAQGTPFVIEDLAPGVDSSADTAVSQPRNIRFFAGQALCADNGEVVGCVALMDFKARGFDVNARHTLVELALLVEEEFNLNAAMASTRAGMAELLDRDAALPSATHIIAYEKIELLVEQAGNAGRKLGIFYLSLDNLYDMSLAYGPGRIQAMINRWMDGLRNHSENLIYIGRLSERGFVGAFEFEGDVRAGRRLCEQLRTHAQQEVEHEELRFSFEASAGLCVSPDHGDSGVALIGRAQLAHENQSWNNETSLFNAAIAKRFRRRSALRTRFEAAVEDGSVYFHGQPIFANEDGALVGIELLARWQDPELGEVSPNEFVPVIDPEKGPRRALVAARHRLPLCRGLAGPVAVRAVHHDQRIRRRAFPTGFSRAGRGQAGTPRRVGRASRIRADRAQRDSRFRADGALATPPDRYRCPYCPRRFRQRVFVDCLSHPPADFDRQAGQARRSAD